MSNAMRPFYRFMKSEIKNFILYETPRIATINSKTVGLVYRALQLLVILYIVVYVLIYERGYQETTLADSVVTTKVKGISAANFSADEFQISENMSHLYERLWDVSGDNMVALDGNGFYIMTNVIITPNQTLGKCEECPKVSGAICGGDHPPCEASVMLRGGHGRTTGNCIPSTTDPEVNVCEIEGWCPVENREFPMKGQKPLLADSENFTVFIKNIIYFREFGPKYRRNNILPHSNKTYLQTCLYDEVTDPLCPIFQIGQIMKSAGANFTEAAYKGAVMTIKIEWDCNLDFDFYDYCVPKYSFERLDNINSTEFHGWNFRHSYYHEFGRRTLLKVYGIKFMIDVTAKGHKFDYIPTFVNIGAGLALMGLAAFICEIFITNCAKSRELFKKKIYLSVQGEDAILESEYSMGGEREDMPMTEENNHERVVEMQPMNPA